MGELLLGPSYGLSKNQLKKTTATVGDVISGKKFYDANGNLVTGTLVDLGSEPLAKGGALWNNHVYYYIGENAGNKRWAITRGVCMPYSEVANLIGLNASMLVSGQWCLGITGTGSTSPNVTVINQSGGWGEGTILSSWGCWSGLTNHIRMAFHWRAESDYNVNGYIRFMKDGNEVAAEAFSKGNGFIDKTFSQSGNYNVQIRVDYHAGNGTFYIGGMFVGY